MKRTLQSVLGVLLIAIAMYAYVQEIGPWYAAFGLCAFGGWLVSKSAIVGFVKELTPFLPWKR